MADRVADDLGRQQGHRVLDVLVEAVGVQRAPGEPRRLRAGLEGEEHLPGIGDCGHLGQRLPHAMTRLTPARTDVRQRTHAFMAAILSGVRRARRRSPSASPALVAAGCGSSEMHQIAGVADRAAVHPAAGAQRRAAAPRARPPAASEGRPPRAQRPRGPDRRRGRGASSTQAFGSRAGRAIDAAGLSAGGLATVPPAAPARVAAIINAANSVARKPYVYGGGHGRLADETFVDTRLRLLGLGLLRAGGGRAWSTARWTPRRWRASAGPAPGAG